MNSDMHLRKRGLEMQTIDRRSYGEGWEESMDLGTQLKRMVKEMGEVQAVRCFDIFPSS